MKKKMGVQNSNEGVLAFEIDKFYDANLNLNRILNILNADDNN